MHHSADTELRIGVFTLTSNVRPKDLRSEVGGSNHENRRRVHCERAVIQTIGIADEEREYELSLVG